MIGWIGTIVVLGSYFLANWHRNIKIFHWGNVIGFAPLAYASATAGAWAPFAVTVSFGLLAVIALLRDVNVRAMLFCRAMDVARLFGSSDL